MSVRPAGALRASNHLVPMLLFAFLTGFTGLTGLGCVRDPVTGKRELVLVSESQEIAMGESAAEDVRVSMGLYQDPEISAYVDELGQRLARASERPHLPWHFQIVDSPVVNAFALPGGYIYVTRGILAYVSSEAALVGVLGHEVGHVTARHSVEQMTKQQLAGLGLGIGTVFFPEVRPFGDVLGGSLSLLFLKFSRDAEREADRLGVRYALRQGYDAREMARFFSVLSRLSGPERNVPSWASTHPDPADRQAAILALLAQEAPKGRDLAVRAEPYKRQIDGLVFGEDPRQGFLEGQRFYHPELAIRLDFPEGWSVQNTPAVVYAAPPDGGAALRLTLSNVPPGTTPEAHARAFFERNGLDYRTGERLRVGPFPAYRAPFRVSGRSGEIYGVAGFIADKERMYELMGLTRPSAFRRYTPVFYAVIESFNRVRDRRILDRQPLRVRLYRVERRTAFRDALRQAGATEGKPDELSLLNDIGLDEEVPAGMSIKVLRRGPR